MAWAHAVEATLRIALISSPADALVKHSSLLCSGSDIEAESIQNAHGQAASALCLSHLPGLLMHSMPALRR